MISVISIHIYINSGSKHLFVASVGRNPAAHLHKVEAVVCTLRTVVLNFFSVLTICENRLKQFCFKIILKPLRMSPKFNFQAALRNAIAQDLSVEQTQQMNQEFQNTAQNLVPESNEIQGSDDASSDTSCLECVEVDFLGHTFEYDKELMQDHFGMEFSKDVWSEIKSKIITGIIDLETLIEDFVESKRHEGVNEPEPSPPPSPKASPPPLPKASPPPLPKASPPPSPKASADGPSRAGSSTDAPRSNIVVNSFIINVRNLDTRTTKPFPVDASWSLAKLRDELAKGFKLDGKSLKMSIGDTPLTNMRLKVCSAQSKVLGPDSTLSISVQGRGGAKVNVKKMAQKSNLSPELKLTNLIMKFKKAHATNITDDEYK
jgi:hypothetical protein